MKIDATINGKVDLVHVHPGIAVRHDNGEYYMVSNETSADFPGKIQLVSLASGHSIWCDRQEGVKIVGAVVKIEER